MRKFKILMALFLISALVFGMFSCHDGSSSDPYSFVLAPTDEEGDTISNVSGGTGGTESPSEEETDKDTGETDKKIPLGLRISIQKQDDIGKLLYNESESTLSLTVPDGYSIRAYYIDKEKHDIDSDGNSDLIAIDTARFTEGIHYIMVVVEDSNGKYYSANYTLNAEK